jgi:hypothetical protein
MRLDSASVFASGKRPLGRKKASFGNILSG